MLIASGCGLKFEGRKKPVSLPPLIEVRNALHAVAVGSGDCGQRSLLKVRTVASTIAPMFADGTGLVAFSASMPYASISAATPPAGVTVGVASGETVLVGRL